MSSSISEHIDRDNNHSSLWWLKNTAQNAKIISNLKLNDSKITSPKQLSLDLTNSVEDLLNKHQESGIDDASDTDIGSIIEEINKLASQSPIGNYENPSADRSVEDILKEAEKLYIESSKSFEQLSSKSRSSYDFSFSGSYKSKKYTPSPKSIKSTSKANASEVSGSPLSKFDNNSNIDLHNNNEDENDNYDNELSILHSPESKVNDVSNANELDLPLPESDRSIEVQNMNGIVINVELAEDDVKNDNMEQEVEEVYLDEEFELDKMEAENEEFEDDNNVEKQQHETLNDLQNEIDFLKKVLYCLQCFLLEDFPKEIEIHI